MDDGTNYVTRHDWCDRWSVVFIYQARLVRPEVCGTHYVTGMNGVTEEKWFLLRHQTGLV